MPVHFFELGSIGNVGPILAALAATKRVMPDPEASRGGKRLYAGILRDNPILNRLIEGGTKALRRGLMSGETLRAPRQQLRWYVPRPSTSLLVSWNLSNYPPKQDLLFTDAFKAASGRVRVREAAASIERRRQIPRRSWQ